ncbi:MAG TPA: glycosyltransferase family 4 protein [Verrucomicrobiae bacterium]|nr:glycosyltransferase family 4 protein [Verrucomicrobiae bacterium]
MNILTHPVHTGYQFHLSQTGHEFYSLEMPGTNEVFWDHASRPNPRNYHRLIHPDEAPVQFDLILAHTVSGFDCLRHFNLPIIYKEHCIRKTFSPPPDWLERVAYYSFASRTAAARWVLPEELAYRKVIIGMGLDVRDFRSGPTKLGRILCVVQNASSRGEEKGLHNLVPLAQILPITTVGRGNDNIPGAVGPARNYDELRRYYASHSVFFNPSSILGLSTLEAMAAGMAVVSFRTINSDIIEHGRNGLVVNSVRDAGMALRKLLRSRELAGHLGRNARRTIQERFSPKLFCARWNALFRLAAFEYHADFEPKLWRKFEIDEKPEPIRQAARELTRGTFEYHRIGYDKRHMTFLESGWVGEGRRARELFWDIKAGSTGPYLELSSGVSLTCRLRRRRDGTWTGRWLHCEKMPIMVRPLAQSVTHT